jgi:putative PIN family toxin of toxin-antitoxin system
VCLDTNVLVSGIYWKGLPGQIIDAWVDEKFTLVVSLPIFEEYREVLNRFDKQFQVSLAPIWLSIIGRKGTMVQAPILKRQAMSRDPKDEKFIDCALSGKAEYLVTSDKDLLVLDDLVQFSIVKPRTFADKIKNRRG